jgi:hypothetical protein
MVKKVVSPARISVVNLVFLICLSLGLSVFWPESSHAVITYMATAIKAEYATKCRSTNIAVQRLERACDGLHSVNRRARDGVEKWWTTRWQLVYVVLKVGSGAVTSKKENIGIPGAMDGAIQDVKRRRKEYLGILQAGTMGTAGSLYARQTTRNVKFAMQARVRK